MRSFGYIYCDERIQIVFTLIRNGRWWYHHRTGEKLGVKFDYPCPQNFDVVGIGLDDLEEMDAEVRSMLFQSLKMDAPEFGLAYS